MAWLHVYIERKYNGPSAMCCVALANIACFALEVPADTLTLDGTKGWRDAASPQEPSRFFWASKTVR